MQHLGAAIGSSLGPMLLTTAPVDELLGVPSLSAFAFFAALPLPRTPLALERVLSERTSPGTMPARDP